MKDNMMKFFLMTICLLSFSSHLHAKQTAKDDHHYLQVAINAYKSADFLTLRTVRKKITSHHLGDFVKWLYLIHEKTPAQFSTLHNFILTHQEWPKIHQLRINAEHKLTLAENSKTIERWCEKFPSLTGNGHKICLLNKIQFSNNIKNACILVKKAWVEGSFNAEDGKLFLEKYSKCLEQNDHIQRVDKLIWHTQLTQAKAILPQIQDYNIKNKFKKRINTLEGKKIIVDAQEMKDLGMTFAIIKAYQKIGKEQYIDSLLSKLNNRKLPYPDKWWPIINYRTREAITHKNYKLAYQIIKNHNLEQGENFAEAEWLCGWLALRFLNNPILAEKHFLNLNSKVGFTISKARAQYWLGRTYEMLKQPQQATVWYKKAATYSHCFYGQLALNKISKHNIILPGKIIVQDDQLKKFRNTPYYVIAKNLLHINSESLALLFLKKIINKNQNKQHVFLTSSLALNDFKKKHIALEVAKFSAQHGMVFGDLAYPKIFLTEGWIIDKSFTHAIIRQESLFNPHAKSKAGALGLMQLMPKTAQQIAHKYGYAFHQSKLTSDPELNIKIGQSYIDHLLKIFSNNKILTIASYNAGLGNVRKWLSNIGDPREYIKIEEVIDWIEHIPFSETRNYIHRVLENYHVYSSLFNKNYQLNFDKTLIHDKKD